MSEFQPSIAARHVLPGNDSEVSPHFLHSIYLKLTSEMCVRLLNLVLPHDGQADSFGSGVLGLAPGTGCNGQLAHLQSTLTGFRVIKQKFLPSHVFIQSLHSPQCEGIFIFNITLSCELTFRVVIVILIL